MSNKLKVYSGTTFEDGKQVSTIVATTSKKRCAELVDERYSYVLTHWSETGNKLQRELAMSKPEVVFKASGFLKDDYKECTK